MRRRRRLGRALLRRYGKQVTYSPEEELVLHDLRGRYKRMTYSKFVASLTPAERRVYKKGHE